MTETDVRTDTVLPDPAADPVRYVLAIAGQRERRARATPQGRWGIFETGGRDVTDEYWYEVGVAIPDRRGALILGDDEDAKDQAEHIAAEANPEHALAEVALWRGVVERHAPAVVDPDREDQRECGCCVGSWAYEEGLPFPCPDLLAVVAAAKAYAGSPA